MVFGIFLLVCGTVAVSAVAVAFGAVICYFLDAYVDVPREQDDE